MVVGDGFVEITVDTSRLIDAHHDRMAKFTVAAKSALEKLRLLDAPGGWVDETIARILEEGA